ncbi:SusC/RagA family TonB-linked outer membrane protein [Ulvibacter antarcticus]|uniref:Iron complex outermembrane receptor protein n=1 Tax=Ulvibacter antarcticus TaxID=442714 RepID=A0A3L9YDV1_9FLAO|nr:SusC/RagA family TonB-linked outer membrane protein [Ulvibacter antarcticus]RMA58831.1 iron complex outermembrane receptor protein [Ulvibacter antarcticus]
MKQLLKKCLFVFSLIPIGLLAQSSVSGTVSDQVTEIPIPGVNVIIKGTTNGTTTNFDGNYTLDNVENDDVIVFSYVGFTTFEVKHTGNSTLNVSLEEDAAILGEVLLIGYGATTKQDATGAVEKVSSEEFNSGSIVSPEQLLSGKSAGVSVTSGGGGPGGDSEIRIRGGSSLAGNNSPLIVLDGIPLDQRKLQGVRNALNAINPNEIEEFVILKDASATAIYGSRASNGVIIITTKKAKKSSPFVIDYGFQFSADQITDKVDVFDADGFRNLVVANDGDVSRLGSSNTDWQDTIYRTANGAIHDLTFSQGFENFTYRANINSTHKQGVLVKDLYRRTALNLNLTGNLLDNHLKMTLTTKGSFDDNLYADTGAIGNAITFDPTQSVRVNNSPGYPYEGYFEFVNGTTGDLESLAPRNPFAQIQQNDNKARTKRNITNLNLDYKFHFLPELKFIANAGYDYSELDGKQFITGKSATQEEGDYANLYSGLNRNINLDLILNYKNRIEAINTGFDLTGGHGYQEYYILSDVLQSRGGNVVTDKTDINRNSLESYFGRASFDIDDKYLISASYRRDGSSRFGPDNRWGSFPGASVGWKISNESFLKDSKSISNLKIRGGYGITGNNEINQNYGYLGVYTPGQSTASVELGGVFVNTLRPEEFDENLKWEETTQYNAGIDIGLFDDFMTINFDGYYRETKDLLARIPVAAGSNLSDVLTTNIGESRSRGLELGIGLNLARKENFNWNVNLNGTLQELEITKLNLSGDPDFFIPQGDISGGVGNKIQLYRPGYDPSTFFVFRQVYDTQGNPIEGAFVDVNGDNQITEEDRQAYKKGSADAYYGFTSTLNYKNFEFNFTLRGSVGNYVYNNAASSTGYYASMFDTLGDYYVNGSTDVLNSNFSEAQLFSDYYIQRADFLKLDNASIGYTIPMEKMILRVTATGTNLFTLTEYDGLDPEIFNGIDRNFYPRPRGFVLGLNFTY